jgi:hypothetical protein
VLWKKIRKEGNPAKIKEFAQQLNLSSPDKSSSSSHNHRGAAADTNDKDEEDEEEENDDEGIEVDNKEEEDGEEEKEEDGDEERHGSSPVTRSSTKPRDKSQEVQPLSPLPPPHTYHNKQEGEIIKVSISQNPNVSQRYSSPYDDDGGGGDIHSTPQKAMSSSTRKSNH